MASKSIKQPAQLNAEDFPLSPEEAAAIAGISRRQLLRYAHAKQILHCRIPKGKREDFRFRKEDVLDFVRETRKPKIVEREEPKPRKAAFDAITADVHPANPEIEYVRDANPTLFRGWSKDDWEELNSTFGHGGALTEEGVMEIAKQINWARPVRRKFEAILHSSHAQTLADLIDSLYKQSLNR